MSIPDPELLAFLTAKYLEPIQLTAAERREVIHIAKGFACKDSATIDGRRVETIRARRKHLYAKLHVSGARDLLSTLLALALQMLGDDCWKRRPCRPWRAPH